MNLKVWKNFCEDRGGNVAMMFTIMMALFVSLIGIALDGSRIMSTQAKLTYIADNAAVAGAYAAENDRERRVEIAREYITSNAHYVLPSTIDPERTYIQFDDESENLTVRLYAKTDLVFGGFLGSDFKNISAESVSVYTTETIDPVTIAFALDVSGSMSDPSSNGQAKIDVLKESTGLLFDAIEKGTKQPKMLREVTRTGMSTYNTEVVTIRKMNWGWDHLQSSIDNLYAAGGTNSTPALQNSYTQLLQDRAFRKARDPKFSQDTLNEYVLFMTDGDNNQIIWDEASAQLCRDMKADGIEIFSVAFTAPEKGELLLLDCASYDDGREDDADNGDQGNIDPSKCGNNGSQGKGQATDHCKDVDDEKEAKENHYFDADDAEAFKEAFVLIGEKISKSQIRLKS